MYRVRKYKKYNRKKNTNKDLFFPSSYSKSNHMTYYQKKGMIIQKSPRLVFNAPTEIMSKEKLDAYYRTLLAYKYQIPAPPAPAPPFDIPPFVIYIDTYIINYFENVDGDFLFSPVKLQSIADAYISSHMPELYSSYNFSYDLYQLQFSTLGTTGSNTQFHIDWYTQQLAEPFQLFVKTVDASQVSGSVSSVCNVVPNGIVDGYVRFNIRRITVASAGGFSSSSTNVVSRDTDISDNGTYSLVSTSPYGDQTGYFTFVVTKGSDYNFYNIRSFIIVYPTHN